MATDLVHKAAYSGLLTREENVSRLEGCSNQKYLTITFYVFAMVALKSISQHFVEKHSRNIKPKLNIYRTVVLMKNDLRNRLLLV